MEITDFPVVVDVPVQWGDQDLFAHVNNCAYLRWFETSRVVYWDTSGLRRLMEPLNQGPILASVKCDYQKQINYPDTIRVGARVRRLGHTSLHMEHAIHSLADDHIAAKGLSIIVLFDYQKQQKNPIPDAIRSVIEKFENRSFTQT